MIKTMIRKALKRMGYHLERSNPETDMTMMGALDRCRARGISINTVIDVGASDGSWTRECLNYFPEAHYLLIEAQEPHKKALDEFSRS